MQGQQKMMMSYKDDSELGSVLSFKLSEAIAEKGKPFSDGEFIKHCLLIFAKLACPEKKHLIEDCGLSRFTVARRIDTMASHLEDALAENINKFSYFSLALDESTDISDMAQLAVFIRGVTDDFEVKEEFLDLASMKSSTTGEDITKEVLKMSEKFRLDPKKLSGLTTDGAPAMVGKHKEFCKNFLETFGSPEAALNHCIIHQENLCSKILDNIDIMKEVVPCINYIRNRGLNHRQFKLFLEELDTDYPDIFYFSLVCWLSRADTLKRFWTLRNEIKSFMESKNQNVAFLSNVEWLNDLAFLTDVTPHLSKLNKQLQGRNQLANVMFEHITSFQKKLELFKGQLGISVLTHFPCLKSQHHEGKEINYLKYSTMIEKLAAAFDDRFQDFRTLECDFGIFSNPFQAVANQCRDQFQLELIDLQCSSDLKRAFDENDLVTFYKNYVRKQYSNLAEHALKMISLFGSTYRCEQFFPK